MTLLTRLVRQSLVKFQRTYDQKPTRGTGSGVTNDEVDLDNEPDQYKAFKYYHNNIPGLWLAECKELVGSLPRSLLLVRNLDQEMSTILISLSGRSSPDHTAMMGSMLASSKNSRYSRSPRPLPER